MVCILDMYTPAGPPPLLVIPISFLVCAFRPPHGIQGSGPKCFFGSNKDVQAPCCCFFCVHMFCPCPCTRFKASCLPRDFTVASRFFIARWSLTMPFMQQVFLLPDSPNFSGFKGGPLIWRRASPPRFWPVLPGVFYSPPVDALDPLPQIIYLIFSPFC